jgi:hypothetical protein
MNETILNPPPLPPGGDPSPAAAVEPPPPLRSLFGAVEALVRRPDSMPHHLREAGAGRLIGWLLAVTIVCALVYGFIVGTFSGHEQLWRAPIKVLGGLLFAGAICLPSLYVLSCLGGSRASLAEVTGLLGGLLALMTLLLLSFAPVAWVFSQSTESLTAMGFLHLLLCGVGLIFGLRLLIRGITQFKARSNAGLACWTVIFVFVLLQMTTALRPLIGTADTFLPTEKRFFLQHWGDCIDGKYSATKSDNDVSTEPAPSQRR